jgi:hypothetical protein
VVAKTISSQAVNILKVQRLEHPLKTMLVASSEAKWETPEKDEDIV